MALKMLCPLQAAGFSPSSDKPHGVELHLRGWGTFMVKERDLGGCEGCPLCAWSLAGMEIHKKAGGIATAVGFVPPHLLFHRTHLQVRHQLWVEFPLNQGCFPASWGSASMNTAAAPSPPQRGCGRRRGDPRWENHQGPSYTRHRDTWRNHSGKTFLSSFCRHRQARPAAVLEQKACKHPWFTCHAFACPVPVARRQHISVNSEALP